MVNNGNKTTGIYIHIPFCVCKCAYCDFLSSPATDFVKENYINALIEEIRLTAETFAKQDKKYIVNTIFIGGGTPTSINPELIKKVLDFVYCKFNIAQQAEITIECNPGTLTKENARIYRSAGINRISFGLQSADNKELRLLGRIHTLEQFRDSFDIARHAGFDNINIDIMSALPGQTYEGFKETVEKVIAFNPEHISAYSLILEEGTRLYEHMEEYPELPDEDAERKMYSYVCERLDSAGYHQYEISNFAKKNFECRHNLSYWERKNYLGFGIGAASLFEERRYTNISNIDEYISLLSEPGGVEAKLNYVREESCKLSEAEQMEEYMFLGLRKTGGISVNDFFNTFNKSIEEIYGGVIGKNIGYGLLQMCGDRLFLTRHGIDVSNVVMADFLLS